MTESLNRDCYKEKMHPMFSEKNQSRTKNAVDEAIRRTRQEISQKFHVKEKFTAELKR
jgi:hypothetical protein